MTTPPSDEETMREPAADMDDQRKLAALVWQVEHDGCMASREGETTYECRPETKCALCRRREERADTERRLAALVEGLRALCDRDERRCTPCAVAHQVRHVAAAVYWKGEVSLTVCAECLAHEIATGNVDLSEPVKHPQHVAAIRALIQSAGPCAPPSSGTE